MSLLVPCRTLSLAATAAFVVLGALSSGCARSDAGEDVASSAHADTADAQSLTACASDGTDASCPVGSFAVVCRDGTHEVDTVAQVTANQICLGQVRGTISCLLHFYRTQCSVGQPGCDQGAVVGTLTQPVRAEYPTVSATLGSSDPNAMPYRLSVRTEGYTTGPSDAGQIFLVLTENTTGRATMTQTDFSLAPLRDTGLVFAQLTMAVPEFTYQGVQYTQIAGECQVTRAH